MRIQDLFRWLRLAPRRARAQADLDAEIRLHLELIERQLRERGLTAEAAHAEARRRFGNPHAVTEDARDALGLRWLDDLRQDAGYALRSLGKDRRYAAIALITLALGIGATTAIFSVVSGLVFRPLPFPHPEALVQIHGTSPTDALGPLNNVGIVHDEATSFAAMSGYEVTAKFLRQGDGADRVMAVQAEPSFFEVLGAAPLRGRALAAGDTPAVAVISERFWRGTLDAREDAVGRALTLDGVPVTIVGIMPTRFQFPYGAASLLPGVASETRTDLWLPLRNPVGPRSRMAHVVARLKPGVSLGAAQSELDVITARLAAADPARNASRGARLVPLAKAVVSPAIRRALFLLFAAVALVLALACVNVTNLSLARLSSRQRDVAIRSALGAGRGRIVRQLLTESAVLSLAGGALGLVLAWIAMTTLLGAAAPFIPRAHEIGLDWRVFLFLFVLCGGIGAAVGAGPAILTTRGDARTVMEQAGGRSTGGRSQRWLRNTLVVAEVAVALVLAAASSLLVRELIRLRHVDSGMVTRNVLTAHVGHRMIPRNGPPAEEDIRQFYAIEDRARQLPGVRAAGLTQLLPLQSWGWSSVSADFRVRGEATPATPPYKIELRFVTPGYFATMGIPILRGRGFTPQDTRDTLPVLVINEALARQAFGSRDPVGLLTTRGTIVGVARDVRQVHLDRPAVPELYTAVAQNWSQVSELGMTVVVSTQQDAASLAPQLRALVRDVNPDLAVFNMKTMDAVVDESLADFTFYLWLIGAFAALALVLVVTGTYGVISCVAMSRVREFAIRAALGANRGRLAGLIVREGAVLGGIGAGLGALATLAVAPLLHNLPVAIRPPDAITIAPAALLLALLAIAASLVPARRASTADPMSVLRKE
jgi:predicted permease